MKKLICALMATLMLLLSGCGNTASNTPEKSAEKFLNNMKKAQLGTEGTVDDIISNLSGRSKRAMKKAVKMAYDLEFTVISTDIDPVLQAGYVLVEIRTYDYPKYLSILLARLQFMLGTNISAILLDPEGALEKGFGIVIDILDEMEEEGKLFSYTANLPVQKIDGKWEIGSDAAITLVMKPFVDAYNDGTLDEILQYFPF